MAKQLNKAQFLRAFECSESGAIANPAARQQYLADTVMADTLQEIGAELGKPASELLCISELQSMEELHYVAANLNWDDGLASATAILQHPLCDAGTALLLYWAGQGYWYSNATRLTPQQQPLAQLFATIVKRFQQGQFASYRIAYDAAAAGMLPSLREMQQSDLHFPGILLARYSTMEVNTEQSAYEQYL